MFGVNQFLRNIINLVKHYYDGVITEDMLLSFYGLDKKTFNIQGVQRTLTVKRTSTKEKLISAISAIKDLPIKNKTVSNFCTKFDPLNDFFK